MMASVRALVLALTFVSTSALLGRAAPLPAQQLNVHSLIAAGNYGAVHQATFGTPPVPAVAKVAGAATGESEELAQAYLQVEREANEAIADNPAARPYFPAYLGHTIVAGDTWLIWERLKQDPAGRTPSLADFVGAADTLPPHLGGLSGVLRHLLQCTSALHEIGYVHRDVKLDNVLIDLSALDDGEVAPLRLIDLGSSAMADGCTVLDAAFGRCTGIDPDASPCSPLYAPPEGFVDPEHPWAFDVFSIGVCVVRLALRCVTDDAQMAAFRKELCQCDGDLGQWVRTRLAATAVEPTLVQDLAAAFPQDVSSDGFALLSAMLRPDPAARPSVASLLAHPYVRGTSATDDPAAASAARVSDAPLPWLPELLDGESCEVQYFETTLRPLVVHVRLVPPLGVLLGEDNDEPESDGSDSGSGSSGSDDGGGGGLTVEGLVDGGAAAVSGAIQVGDRLVLLGGKDVREATLEDVTRWLGSRSGGRGRGVELAFERDCTADACDVRGTALASATTAARPDSWAAGRARLPGRRVGVVDAGAAASIGQRASMEDAHVLTSFTAIPRLATDSGHALSRSFVLAAVFDGHRGDRAAQYAATALPDAVRRAVERGEPAPLAAAYRDVADGYLRTGHQDGACATMALIGDNGLIELLNVGDCRALLGAMASDGTTGTADAGGGCVVELATRDHDAADELEGARIANLGGRVRCASNGAMRVAVDSTEGRWQVAVARAVGGSEWKAGGITDAAEVYSVQLHPRHRFLVLATDGVIGPLEDAGRPAATCAARSEPIAWRVAAAQEAGTRAEAIADALVACAARDGGTDNASCVVLLLGDSGGS